MDADELQIRLPQDLAQMVRHEMRTGAYASDIDLIRDALHLWQERQRRLDEIRRTIDEAAEDPEEITAEALHAHFERRFAEAETMSRP